MSHFIQHNGQRDTLEEVRSLYWITKSKKCIAQCVKGLMVDLILNDLEDDMRKCYDILCTCVTTRGVDVLEDAHV